MKAGARGGPADGQGVPVRGGPLEGQDPPRAGLRRGRDDDRHQELHRAGHADDVTACLVPEPEENQLCISMKGAIRAVVRVRGRMAHGAMPLTGINPNTRLARIILAFERYEIREKERCGSDPLLGLPSVTFTVIQSPPPGSPAAAQRDARGSAWRTWTSAPCWHRTTIRSATSCGRS